MLGTDRVYAAGFSKGLCFAFSLSQTASHQHELSLSQSVCVPVSNSFLLAWKMTIVLLAKCIHGIKCLLNS